MLINTILLCDILLLLLLLLYLSYICLTIFLYVYGPCVCNKDILLLLLLLLLLIDLYLNKKKIYCALIDYKRAFDCVDRTLLWQRILESNVNGKLFRVIYNVYDAAKSCIKVRNNLSEVCHCNIGVRQGENLSPVLFAMLINEFKNNLSTKHNGVHINQLYNTDIDHQLKLFTLLYADDTIILAETERELQSVLDAVHEYCNNMHLTVNTQKTKVMIFSRGKVRKYQNFIFGSSILDVTYEYVYLGVNFKYNTSFIKLLSDIYLELILLFQLQE